MNQNNELVKISFIRKLPDGRFRVFSENGKNMGTFPTQEKAKKRLRQVEFFKITKASVDEGIDLTEIDAFTYSAIIRELRKSERPEVVEEFLKIFKSLFDKEILKGKEINEEALLMRTIKYLDAIFKIKINENFVKQAASIDLGDAETSAKYIADFIRFFIRRIKPEARPKALRNLADKIFRLNENELSNKKMPASASLGQSITFVKNILIEHNASYIREVLNEVSSLLKSTL
jgi:hypothetical protein